jgi:DNA invertase Pin-like site-specific DNA recombinase
MSNTKNRYKPQIAEENAFDAPRTIANDRPVAVYYRQSTFAQVGNISTKLQTVDWIDRLKHLGWKPDDITLVDMDAGISGTKKIDERPGMKYLFELISEGKIGTVACEDEDRLFRDVTQIQVSIFVEACRPSHVLVMTPSMAYDFANEQMGNFHARQFRFKSELAAEYINTFVKGKLLRAKRRLALEGRWFGGRLPPGYMIDMRKSLPDGSANPNWRKFAPFEPYVEVVNEYFRMFLSHAGNLNATLRDIHHNGPFYPDPQKCHPPVGYRTVYPTKRFKNGYCPGITGMVHLLSNAVYVGHWMVNDAVHIRNNHPAIVPEDVFWKAFNYLSTV